MPEHEYDVYRGIRLRIIGEADYWRGTTINLPKLQETASAKSKAECMSLLRERIDGHFGSRLH